MSAPIVVVGGGLAAGTLVTQLRERGHDGDVVAPRRRGPRTVRAPAAVQGPAARQGRARRRRRPRAGAGTPTHDVDLRTGTAATAIDLAGREVSGRRRVARLRPSSCSPPAPGRDTCALADDSGAPVVYLRTLDDSLALRERRSPTGARIGIIGGGWIGLEVASAARAARRRGDASSSRSTCRCCACSGPRSAQVFADLHREHGVDLRTGVQVTAVIAARRRRHRRPRRRRRPSTSTSSSSASASSPDAELAEAAGLTVDNGIRTDARLRTADAARLRDRRRRQRRPPGARPPAARRALGHRDQARQGRCAATCSASTARRRRAALLLHRPVRPRHGVRRQPRPRGLRPGRAHAATCRGRVFRAWWLRGDRVVAGMHVNDWDAIDEIRRVVGHRGAADGRDRYRASACRLLPTGKSSAEPPPWRPRQGDP